MKLTSTFLLMFFLYVLSFGQVSDQPVLFAPEALVGTSNNNFVGVGTNNPSAMLDIRGHLHLTGNISGETPGHNRIIRSGESKGAYLHLFDDFNVDNKGELALVSGQNGHVIFGNYTDNNWSSQMIIKSNGKVGIGTDNPVATLDLRGNLNITGHIYGETPDHNRIIRSGASKGSYIHLYDDDHDSNKGVLSLVTGQNGHVIFGNYTDNNWSSQMIVKSNGKVGIGTDNPIASLDLRGNLNITGNISGQTLDNNRIIRSGVSKGSYIHLYDDEHDSNQGDLALVTGQNGKLIFGNYTNNNWSAQMEVNSNGKVGIGTDNFPTQVGSTSIAQYKLFVEGGILSDEVRVFTGWADYVFYEDYNLFSILQLEEFINQNGHLPNVPSADQVEEEGIDIGEMTRIQQEKIEELTLYIISLQKQIDELKILTSPSSSK